MGESIKQKLGFVVAAMMVVAALAALNLGVPAGAQQNGCTTDGGGNGTASPSPSPTESEEPFPPSLPPILPEESESASPSPSDTAGESRTCTSDISINYQGPDRRHPERREFSGNVKSGEDACESGRKVFLKKDRRTGRDRTVDTTITNDRGKWRIPVRRANGKYYAKTPQEKVPSQSGGVTCKADRSKAIRV